MNYDDYKGLLRQRMDELKKGLQEDPDGIFRDLFLGRLQALELVYRDIEDFEHSELEQGY